MGGAILLRASLVLAMPLSYQLRPFPQPGSSPARGPAQFPVGTEAGRPTDYCYDEIHYYSSGTPGRIPCINRTGSADLFAVFLFRIDENLENPGTFRTEMLVS